VPIVQALAEGSHEVRRVNELHASQEPDHGHRRLLRPCGERPRRDRAGNRLRVVSKECLPGAHALGLG